MLPVIFEDHAAQDFRPLGWSQPVYEHRCGLFNLRERILDLLVGLDCDETSCLPPPLSLLPRSLLLPLHRAAGVASGPVVCRRELTAASRTLWLNARLGPRWDLLATLIGESCKDRDFVWRDAKGLLAAGVDRCLGEQLLGSWEDWDRQSHESGCWTRGTTAPPPWGPWELFSDWPERSLAGGWSLRFPGGSGAAAESSLTTVLQTTVYEPPAAFGHIWDLMLANGAAIVTDVRKTVSQGRPFNRDLFGIETLPEAWPDGAPWLAEKVLAPAVERADLRARGDVVLHGAEDVWLADNVRIDPLTVLDAGAGPIVLDSGVHVMSHSILEGPLYVGPGSLIKAGARVGGEVSLGAVCKVAGEVAESVFGDFVNKQHDGFIGHAVIGGWVNLGAGTTCSDLKNNYGPIQVDLGLGFLETGQRFLGLLMGEHSKSAIGTLFNTGACVGFSCNVFGSGLVRKCLPNFTWGAGGGSLYGVNRAIEAARIVMGRRGVALTPAQEGLFRALGAPPAEPQA
jgi:UDP-N-acetylglucosamine diphosphorylase/glucosamine-1-phosphate N-acetyltransferase